MKAAIYTRYSSDHQRETSIEDQNRKCELYAKREGWKIVARYEDRAISGATRNRPGYQAMLTAAKVDAKEREFDALLVDAQSRLGRDQVEVETAFRRLEHLDIRIICLADGYDSIAPKSARKMQRAMKGIINESYLDQLAADTHRGLEGRVLKGFSGGGRAYGYTSEPIENASKLDRYGKPEVSGYKRKVDESQRPVVVDIFSMYADGMNPKAIARELNRRGISSPGANWRRKNPEKRRDGKWMASAVYNMLDNEIYAGQVVWNKSVWVKDPDTGRRIRRPRLESEWHRMTDESLRIISEKLSKKVKARQEQVKNENKRLRESLQRGVLQNGAVAGRKPSNFWSGLLVCGKCGRNFIKVSRYQYGCGSYANGGEHACGNSLRALASMLDDKILATIKAELVSDERIQVMARAMQKHFEKRMRELTAESAKERIRERLTAVAGELQNVADAIAKVGFNEALSAKLDTLTQEKKRLRAEMKSARSDPRLGNDLAKALPALMRQNVAVIEQLGTNKRKADRRMVWRAQRAMEAITGKIELVPAKKARQPHLVAKLELTGERLALLMQQAAVGKVQQKQAAIKMVAGARYGCSLEPIELRK
jgi:DNA invertase Pin-like site-specific DNA recombinase